MGGDMLGGLFFSNIPRNLNPFWQYSGTADTNIQRYIKTGRVRPIGTTASAISRVDINTSNGCFDLNIGSTSAPRPYPHFYLMRADVIGGGGGGGGSAWHFDETGEGGRAGKVVNNVLLKLTRETFTPQFAIILDGGAAGVSGDTSVRTDGGAGRFTCYLLASNTQIQGGTATIVGRGGYKWVYPAVLDQSGEISEWQYVGSGGDGGYSETTQDLKAKNGQTGQIRTRSMVY